MDSDSAGVEDRPALFVDLGGGGFIQTFFKFRGDDAVAPDVCSCRVWFLAGVDCEEGGGVAGLDDLAGEDGVG